MVQSGANDVACSGCAAAWGLSSDGPAPGTGVVLVMRRWRAAAKDASSRSWPALLPPLLLAVSSIAPPLLESLFGVRAKAVAGLPDRVMAPFVAV